MDFLYALQNLRTPALDVFFLIVSKCAEEVVVLVPLIVFYWCMDKKMGLRLGFVYFAGGIVGQFSKLIFRIERPFLRDARLSPQPDAVAGATGYSFPSGHTTSATSLAASFILAWRKKWWVWLLGGLYVLLVGFSRLYLGVHTPQDVLCAIAFTAAMAVVVDFAWKDCEKRASHAKWWFLLCGGAALAMLIYAAVTVKMGIVPADQAADAFKTGGAAFALLLGVGLDRKFVNFTVAAPRKAQIIKGVLGGVVALALKEGLKLVLGTSLPMQFLRYFIVVLFVVIGYPWMFTRFLHRKRN